MAAEEFERAEPRDMQSVVAAQGKGAVVIDDASLLYGADFLRDGPDLVLRNDGAEDIRIVDYFRAAEPADLHSPDGGTLRGQVVERLAGPEAPGQYAQAGQAGASVPIGQVEAVAGAASVQRTDGTSEPLTTGSRVFLDDVVRTVGDSTLSITFADGTIFTLSADSRMVIDELIYAPDGNGNSATFNLVQGGFVFIAGQVARTGGMEVNTPAATMGIRGTTVLADVQTQGGVSTVEVTLTRDPDGGIGRVELFDLDGNLITTITGIDTKWIVSTDADETREVERTAEDEAADNVLIAEAIAAHQTAQGRFAQDGSFIRLDTLPRETDGEDTLQDGRDEEIDLDSEDTDVIPDRDDAPAPDRQDTEPFDDGRLVPPFETPPIVDVIRTALEDSEEEPVSGDLRSETSVAGAFTLLSGASNGTVSLSADGSYDYAPDPDFNGVDSFTYSVTRTDGRSFTGTVTINVLPVNDAPQIEDANAGGVEDTVILGSAVATDIDSVALVYWLGSGAANGAVVVTSTGAWAYTPDPDFAGVDSFEIAVSDGEGAAATQRVTVDVAGVNDAPVAGTDSVPADPTVVENVAPSVSGVLTAMDPDAGDALIWTGSAEGSHGAFAIAASGMWTYTLGSAANVLSAGQVVTDSFTATVTDASGASDTREVSIRVVGGNDAPIIAEGSVPEDPTVFENVASSVSGTLTATDPDTRDALVWAGSAAGSHGMFTITPAGVWSYTLGAAANTLSAGRVVVDSFTATVTDAAGASDTREISIRVVGANDAPVASNVAFLVTGGAAIDGALAASDPDAGDTLTFALGPSGPARGTVELQGDGSFTYTPEDGFSGLDGFDYVVSDASGATVTARASLSVESGAIDVPGGGKVSVSIHPDTEVGPAGQIVATSTDPEAMHVNLVFALDRSGSIGEAGWNTQINAVADALMALAAEFDGSATQVDVNVIAYSGAALSTGTFDLADPNLASTVRSLPMTGGGTNWGAALVSAENFFDSQPAGELNYLYFTSDGNPSGSGWRIDLARLTDSGAKGYAVQVEAFGIGASVNETNLKVLDDDPVLLSGPADLLAAFEASPLFAPQLVELSVRLIADGVDMGEVADESAPGLVEDGFDTKLALADIAGLAELLGEDNLISVSVGYDIDRDASTAEIGLFTSQAFSRQAAAMSLDGTEESDLLLGSDFADVLAGNGGNDIILGFDGDDLILTGAGLDHVRAGAGNDRIVLESADPSAGGFADMVDGGAGRDVLAVAFGGDLDADVLDQVDLRGIEALDIDNGQANSLSLTLEDVIGLSGDADTELESLLGAILPESLTVLGDGADALMLLNGAKGGFVDAATTVTDADGTTLDIYTYMDGGEVLATLAVDSDVAVTVATSAA